MGRVISHAIAPWSTAGSARRKSAIRAATQPPTTKAKNAPPMLKMSVINRTFFQVAAFETSWAPTANPIKPMTSPTASADSAPTMTALQTTGQGLQPRPPERETPQSTCRLLGGGGPVGAAKPGQHEPHVGGALHVDLDPAPTPQAAGRAGRPGPPPPPPPPAPARPPNTGPSPPGGGNGK